MDFYDVGHGSVICLNNEHLFSGDRRRSDNSINHVEIELRPTTNFGG